MEKQESDKSESVSAVKGIVRQTKLRALNLYAGLGGNRKYWHDIEVTAVEIKEEVAGVYSEYYPDDEIIVADAHEYLKNNYGEFDFIWASPPCQTHSRINTLAVNVGTKNLDYPDMKLWQEIIFCQNWVKVPWLIENVKPYYEPLIPPTKRVGRHNFWSNFKFANFEVPDGMNHKNTGTGYLRKELGFDLRGRKIKNKQQLLRNCVHPNIGWHIFDRVLQIHAGKYPQQQPLFA